MAVPLCWIRKIAAITNPKRTKTILENSGNEHRNRGLATYDSLGFAEYEAMEAFVATWRVEFPQ